MAVCEQFFLELTPTILDFPAAQFAELDLAQRPVLATRSHGLHEGGHLFVLETLAGLEMDNVLDV